MFLDSQLMFSDGQAIAASAISTNVVDLGGDFNIGKGEPMAVIVTVGVDANFTANETYQFIVQTSVDEAFSSPVALVSSAAIPAADLTAGKSVVLFIPYDNLQYLRVSNVLAGTTPTITIDSYLQPANMIDGLDYLPNGYTIV